MAAAGAVRELVAGRVRFWALVERQLRLRAKRSVMGVLWPFLAPLFLLGLYAFVFGSVFDVPVDDYPAYLFVGLLPWTFLVQAVHDALPSISFEPELVRRAPFPHQFLPLSRVVVMAVPFLALLVAALPVLAATHGLDLVVLPVLLVPLASVVLLVGALAMALALVDVFSRDLRFVLHNLLTVWFFLVPIVYTRRMAGDQLRLLRAVDPMNHVITQFRHVLYDGVVGSPVDLALTLAACAGLFAASLALFRRLSADLAKEV